MSHIPAPAAMSDNPRTLTSFTIFPNLPFEIRCLIWKTTCESRTVEIAYDSDDGFTTILDPPTALEVCQESRNLLISHYPLCFGSIYHPAKIRFNFSLDTLYLDNSLEDDLAHVFSTFREREISSLKYLAIDSYFGTGAFEEDFSPFEGVKRAVKSLTGLKELLIVYHVDNLSPRIIGCGGDHKLSLFDQLPSDLADPKFELPALSALTIKDFDHWKLAAPARAIYGWRRCPDADDIMGSPRAFFRGDLDSDEDSEMELGRFPFPIALGMGMLNPGHMYGDTDEDSEGDDEEDSEYETTDDEMPDLGDESDDEMPGLGSGSANNGDRSEAASLD